MAEQGNDGGVLGDLFDRAWGSLEGLPGALTSQRATVQSAVPLLGTMETFIVQTVRHADSGGDSVFVQVLSAARSLRLVLPPKVAAVMARQRDQLTDAGRRRGARQALITKRNAGIPIGNASALLAARAARAGKPRKARRRRARKAAK